MAETIAIWLISTFGAANAAGVVVVSMAALEAVTAIVSFVALVGAKMAVNKLLAPKMPSYDDPSLASRTQMVRSPIAARQIIYGETKVSGVIVYLSTTGTKNEYLHLVVALAGHQVQEIGDVYFNDELALTGAGSAATGRFTGKAEIYKKLGLPDQVAQPQLIAATAGLANGQWTSQHRLLGIAYIYVQLTWDQQVFAGGIPNISAMVKGKQVYDSRYGVIPEWSQNPAACLRDYLTNPTYGLGLSDSEIDDSAFEVAANICDEGIECSSSEPGIFTTQYQCNGVLYTSASTDENIGKLLSAMGGLIAYSGGKIVPYAASYRIPTVTLTDSDFAGPLSVQTKTSSRDRVNGVKGVYVSAETEWQPTDFPPVTSATFLSQDNGVRYWRDVVLPMTTSSCQAQRLARIELMRGRQEITFTARFRLSAMQIRAGDTVMVTLSKFGWVNKVFEVIDWTFVSDGQPPQLGIEMTMRETASSVYDFYRNDSVIEQAPTTTLPNPFTLGAPTNLALVADGTTQLIQADGTALPRIKVSWSAPSEQFIQSGGQTVIEYKQGNAVTYLTWSKVGGDQELDFISSDVRIGTSYNVRIYGESYFGVSTSYLTGNVTVAKDTTAPSTPTGLVAIVGTGKAVSLDWADNTEPDFSEYGIYRNTTGVTPASASVDKVAEVRASRFVDTEVTLGTTYYYWVNAYDAVENVSGFATRVTAVPTYISGASVDTTAPSTPSAPTFLSETTYLASDGTALARITVTAPPMPTGGALLTILFRRSGASEWQVADLVGSGSIAVSIDDLTTGQDYEFAARAISNFDVPSSVSATLSRTAPNYSGTVTAPSSATLSSTGVKPRYVPGTLTFLFGTRASWSPNTQLDFAYYEIKATANDTDADTNYTWFSDSAGQPLKTRDTFAFLYNVTNAAGYVRVRAVNRTGTASAWVALGNANANSSIGTGTISSQNSNDVNTTGIRTGSGASVRQVNVVYDTNEVVTLTGGDTFEYVQLNISGRGFSAKPDSGIVVVEDVFYGGFYDFATEDSTSTTAFVMIYRYDGANLSSGNLRLSAQFIDYS